jgi:Mg2+ and Co2+ transporter CorA
MVSRQRAINAIIAAEHIRISSFSISLVVSPWDRSQMVMASPITPTNEAQRRSTQRNPPRSPAGIGDGDVEDGNHPPAPSARGASEFSKSGTNLLQSIASGLEIPDNLDDAEAAAARFDCSPFRLWLLFQTVDENRDGYISKAELVHALSSACSTQKESEGITLQLPTRAYFHEERQEYVEKEENKDPYETDDDEEEEGGFDEVLPLEDVRALDELWDRVVAGKEEEKIGENQPQSADLPEGISFPQFCRIIRYLWLQQLLNPELDNRNDPQHHYEFECVDYASGYYRHKSIAGNAAEKKSRNFFTAPRHGHARMRWIDVPSGKPVPEAMKTGAYRDNYQQESFRITILRLAVKYRFHPTSIEDAIDLEYQEPKVNSFEHSLRDLGNYNCGTISWLRHAGFQCSTTIGPDNDPPNLSSVFGLNKSINSTTTAVPQPRPAARASSTQSFHTYHNETDAMPHIPDFVIAEGEDDIQNEGRHYFITIPMFELSRRSQTSLDLYVEALESMPMMQVQPLVIEVNEATLGLFVASQPDANLVVTCSTKWRPTRIKPFKFRNNRQANNRQQKAIDKQISADSKNSKNAIRSRPIYDFESDSSVSSGAEVIQKIFEDEKMALTRVKGLLQKRHSIQRHRNSNWLMHAILDAVVDNLIPISKIYEAQLQRMSTRLFELQHQLSKQEVKEMIVMRRNLEWLQHELRPFARVIRHLIDDKNIGAEVTHYLEDVEDNLLRTLEELSSYASECVSLKDEYNAYLDRRMNDILYVLTLVTALVVPAQFLTGYYGMNFEDSEGLGDPLLRMGTTGVVVFWGMTGGFTLLVLVLMYRCNFFEKALVE